jgi:hypothetical protein
LPTSYEVLIGADGNDGGAPGVTLKVVPTSASNIATDSFFTNEVQVQVSDTFTDLSHSLNVAETDIDQSLNSNRTGFIVTDAMLGGLAAKHISLDQDEYSGTINVYVTGSGSWEYKVTSNVPGFNNAEPSAILRAVLNGTHIRQIPSP